MKSLREIIEKQVPERSKGTTISIDCNDRLIGYKYRRIDTYETTKLSICEEILSIIDNADSLDKFSKDNQIKIIKIDDQRGHCKRRKVKIFFKLNEFLYSWEK